MNHRDSIVAMACHLVGDRTPKLSCISQAVLPSSRPAWMECESASTGALHSNNQL